MIQGGGFNEQMQQKKPNPPIKNEADNGLRNTRGTIAMARTADKDSATSQFFLLTSRITLFSTTASATLAMRYLVK